MNEEKKFSKSFQENISFWESSEKISRNIENFWIIIEE